MPDLKIIAQVAKLEERVNGVEDNLSLKIDNIDSKVGAVIKGQEEQWREFRRHEREVGNKLNEIILAVQQHGNQIKGNREHCDERFETLEKAKKVRMTLTILGCTGVGTVGWDLIKILLFKMGV